MSIPRNINLKWCTIALQGYKFIAFHVLDPKYSGKAEKSPARAVERALNIYCKCDHTTL